MRISDWSSDLCSSDLSPGGNLLWDCIALVDDDTVARVREAGGIRAIAISHPHYYSGMVEWSRAFGGVPILLHAADREWVMRDAPAIEYWEGGTRELWDGMTLVRCGGDRKSTRLNPSH